MPDSDNLNNITSKDSTMIDLIHQIVEVLQTSTIAEERGKDVSSKFWAAYKKVSGEYDDNMLERCNGNMDIVLIFAGLFSAVNTAFIIAMQPNPVDTTNVLLVQLTAIYLHDSSAAQPLILSPSTGYSSSNAWMQALAYESLAFSLLAAFGAVLGKQWLGYYKTNRYDRGSLEDRCKQRHRKFQELETWQFENVLQSFTVLLQISLFLFGLSLGAAMWTQQRVISILIIATTAFGALCYAVTILVSLISPDCPFQTPVSLAIQAVVRRFRADAGSSSHHSNDEQTAFAMWWILDTSTNPDILRTAFELMITLSKTNGPEHSFPSRLCDKVLDMLKECFGITTLENNALVYGKALIHLFLNYPKVGETLRRSTQGWKDWKSWRELYLPRALEHCKISHSKLLDTDEADLSRYQADTRTALRMVVAVGTDEFTDPDDESSHLSYQLGVDLPDVDWLMGCVEHFCGVQDFTAARYALLLLSGVPMKLSLPVQKRFASILNKLESQLNGTLRTIALRVAYNTLDYKDSSPCDYSFSQAVLTAMFPHTAIGLHNHDFYITSVKNLLTHTAWPADSHLASCTLQDIQLLALLVLPTPRADNNPKYHMHYCETLIRYMDPRRPHQFRHTALRRACDVGQYLPVSLHSELSQALLGTVRAAGEQPKNSDADEDYYYYARLVFALAKSSNWHPHLVDDGYSKGCIQVILQVLPESYDSRDKPLPCLFYLTGILLRTLSPRQPSPPFGTLTMKQQWDLMKVAWRVAGDPCDQQDPSYISDVLDDGAEMLETLAMETPKYIPEDALIDDLQVLREWLGKTADKLESRKAEAHHSTIVAVKNLRAVVRRRLP